MDQIPFTFIGGEFQSRSPSANRSYQFKLVNRSALNGFDLLWPSWTDYASLLMQGCWFKKSAGCVVPPLRSCTCWMFTNSIGTSRTSPPLLHRKGLRGHPNAVRLDLSRSSTARWNADRSRFLLTPRHGKQMSDINNVKSKDQDIQSCLIHH